MFIKSLLYLMQFLFVLYLFCYWNPPDSVLQAWPCLSCCRRVCKSYPGLELLSGHGKGVTSLVISVRFCLNSPSSFSEKEGTNVALSVHPGISPQLCIQQHPVEALNWPWSWGRTLHHGNWQMLSIWVFPPSPMPTPPLESLLVNICQHTTAKGWQLAVLRGKVSELCMVMVSIF